MTDPLHGFDMIVALTQNAVNAQLNSMSRIGALDPDKAFFPAQVDWDTDNGTVQAKLGVPSVDFVQNNSNYQEATFILPLISGTLTTYTVDHSTKPPSVKTRETDIKDWQVAFSVDLSKLAFDAKARDKAASEGSLATAAHKKLEPLSDALFDVSALILDFSKADIAAFDPTHTRLPGLTGPETTVLATALTVYFQQERDKPFIMSVNAQSRNPANTASQVAPTLVPTGVSYTVYGNASTAGYSGPPNGLSTLNMLVSTDGHAAPPAKPNGILSAPLVTDNLHSGNLLITRASLVDNFLLKQLGQHLGARFATAGSPTKLTSTSTGPGVDFHKKGTFKSPGTVKTTGSTTITITATLSQTLPEISFSGTIATEATFSITFIWNGTWQTWRNIDFTGKMTLSAGHDPHTMAAHFQPFSFGAPYRPRSDSKNTGAKVDQVITLGQIDSLVDNLLKGITSSLQGAEKNILNADQAAVPTLFVPPTGDGYSVTPAHFDANGDFVIALDIETA